MIGKTILNYKILEKLGEGGMGVVYKATDTKLKRTVALKFLPLNSLGSKQEKSRFLREAQASAALNHPNIATVYTIDEHDGQSFIAMEYIEGKTLKEIVEEGPMKLKKAIDYAGQIATGLHAAHEQGVVHRDIKSANVIITGRGEAKIMDFGLAKLAGSSMLTKQGTSMGTAAYMSPEQTLGEEVDYRTDIWSLGVLLYEMITGTLPFKGHYEQALVYEILNADPEPPTAVRTGIPTALERIIFKMLTKDPTMRYQNAIEIPVDLKSVNVASTGSTVTRATPTLTTISPPRPISKPKRRFATWMFAATTLVLAALLIWRLWVVEPASRPVTRVTVSTATTVGFGNSSPFAISRDGKYLACVQERGGIAKLYLRSMDAFDWTELQGTQGASDPFFSPDGQQLGFYANRELKKVSVFGGVPNSLAKLDDFFGAVWAEKDTIYFAAEDSNATSILAKISVEGGPISHLKESRMERLRWPALLPSQDALFYTVLPATGDDPDAGKIELLSFETGESRQILEGGVRARYSASGHIIAGWSGGLLAAPFNLGKRKVVGPTIPILEGLHLDYGLNPQYALSSGGTLIYLNGQSQVEQRRLFIVAKDGSKPLFETAGPFSNPRFSPDESRIAVVSKVDGLDQIFLVNIADGKFIQFTHEGSNTAPVWKPNSKTLTFSSQREGSSRILSQATDSGSAPVQLVAGSEPVWPASWTPDAHTLAFIKEHPDSSLDIWFLEMPGKSGKRGKQKATATPANRPVVATQAAEQEAAFSGDGKWLAYVSNINGQNEVFVRALENPRSGRQVSQNGGRSPVWDRGSDAIYFLAGKRLMTTSASDTAGSPSEVLKLNRVGQGFDYSARNGGFLFLLEARPEGANQLQVVLNWVTELNAKIPSGKSFMGIEF